MAKLPKYKITVDDEFSDGEDLGWEKTAFTNKPAVLIKGMAYTSQSEHKHLSFADGKKYRIAAPLMIPMEIYRNDEFGEYYVEFTESEIERIHKKKMSKLTTNKGLFNLEHDNGETVPAYLLEVWIVDNPEKDRSFSTFGVKVPKGTLFGVAQITDKEYYNELVKNEQTGFSIEGFLGMKLKEHKLKKANLHPNCKCDFIDGELKTEAGACDFCLTVKREIEKENNKTKNKTKMEENTKLPEGARFQIEDKWYEVKDGKVIEVVEAEKEVAASEDKKEEVELAEEVVEEEKKKEEVELSEEVIEEEKKEEEVELADEVIEEEVVSDSYTKEEVDAKFDELYKMIAELKEDKVEDVEEVNEVALSVHDRISAFTRFSNKK